MIELASRNDVNVLIEGETGTGKELVAQAIHRRSDRKSRRFVAINCTAIPFDLTESELFGHERGAFTHATQRRVGKFELAQDGTVLLDEIGDMDRGIQAKLLRVLEERQFNRIGGNESIELKARIITSTNKSLLKKVKDDSFREDLYYRISEFTISVPPLRERKEDIPLLVDHFIKNGNGSKSISNRALDKLMEYDWPGNVRELKNVVRKAAALNPGNPLIDEEDIEIPEIPTRSDCIIIPYDLTLDQAEEIIIRHMLKIYNGDKRKVSEVLQISIATLYNKLKKFHSKIKI
jgi:transcriptional regulator with PAS, ATPase and Fis domain